ncbi:hypothetical protein OIU74_016902 [Salix koriyanagi]|uniref:Uncharacterized protein n=1 Tax=Salix koriyanagi TaxID=2511006 RepID=A0A9Q0SSZ6_9ROSI|nr:hypothetical protein OIU74_016902 [Salix koriyanagi]
MNETEKVTDGDTIKILCPRLILTRREPGLQWLIGSPFFPPFTIISTFKSIHTSSSSSSPDLIKESDDLRTLLIKGFDIIGGLIVGGSSCDDGEKNAREVIVWAREIERALLLYEENQEKFVWERGCLFRCNLPIKMPVYLPVKNEADAEKMYLRAAEVVASSFKDPLVTYMILQISSLWVKNLLKILMQKKLTCAHFCSKSKSSPALISVENADVIQVSVLFNRSGKSPKSSAPFAEYIPALEEARLFVVDFQLEVLCYVAKDLLLILTQTLSSTPTAMLLSL